MSILDPLRQDKDFFFRTDPGSPIPDEDREAFTGLTYFPYDDDLCFQLEMQEFLWKEEVFVPLTSGAAPGQAGQSEAPAEAQYVRTGRIRFPVNGKEQTLTVLESEGGLFLPFMDATCGDESYEGGRYLEPDRDVYGKLLVDFNLAYNPFCAYSHEWSCPIVPMENRLIVPIRAGEKRYVRPRKGPAAPSNKAS